MAPVARRAVGQDSFNALDNDPVIVLESSTALSRIPSRWGVNLLSISGPGKLLAGTGIGQDRDDGEGMRDNGVIFHDFEEAVRCAEKGRMFGSGLGMHSGLVASLLPETLRFSKLSDYHEGHRGDLDCRSRASGPDVGHGVASRRRRCLAH
jgi:hypothetical protein